MRLTHLLGRRLVRLCAIAGFATLVFLLVIHFTPVTARYARLLAGDWTDASGDTLIVLGSEVESDGITGPSTYLRTVYALRAWREHPFHTIIVTGGLDPGSPLTIAEAMRDFLIGNGVPAGIIRTENRATSTRENALFVKQLLPAAPGKIVLMTSDFHMFRARRVFEKAGLHVVPRPIPDVLKRSNHLVNRWVTFWNVVTETIKIGYYALRGWI
jgi:uncharacterized SAM-binding protein YcdF (DUF218 family)